MTMWIISGPSSAGKSHFITSGAAAAVTGLQGDIATLFPDEAKGCNEKPDTFFLHYNILRPLSIIRAERAGAHGGILSKLACLFSRWREPRNTISWPHMLNLWQYKRDAALDALLRTEPLIKAIVLVADRQTILDRIRQRETVEPFLQRNRRAARYPGRYWTSVYNAVDLPEIYRRWCDYLRCNAIEYKHIHSAHDRFEPLQVDTKIETILT
ncbi:MAG: ATP-binding protein [Deltaproteobacteria bacterium]|nr:ATP-binding protein [Deltaproteobacteria bacterium]